ncbi:MAG: OmpA family protein [Bacteroidota bacterium]
MERLKPAMLSLLGLLLCYLQPVTSLAQFGTPVEEDSFFRKNIIKKEAVLVKEDQADILLRFGAQPAFPNIDGPQMYYNKKALSNIAELEANGLDEMIPDRYLEQLDRQLVEYVHQFGIENFSKNVDLLWKTGRVKQLLGDTAKALYYYELAKIHNYGTRSPVFSYDTLIETSEWVNIEEYYEMLDIRRKIDPLIPPKEVLVPMGDQINSLAPDYAPFVDPSDSILIFTSRRDTTGMIPDSYVDPFAKKNEDLYYSEIDFMSGEWQEAVRLPDSVNSEFNEGSACLAPDGLTLYFTSCRQGVFLHTNNRNTLPEQKKRNKVSRRKKTPQADIQRNGMLFGSCDIYKATYDPTTQSWGHVQNLGKQVNSESWDSQPNMSADGRTLFFVSNRKGGFGGTDIYYSTLGEDGRWSKASNLGPMINSPKNEVTPFFHKINSTLYFSSTGQMKNFGSYDIFKARWMGTDWEQPKNVGPLVNTRGNQYYFSISGKGTTIFYSNAKDTEKDHVKQNFDLFSFPMPMEARPDAIAQLKGFLVDSVSGYPLRGKVMVIDTEEGIEITPKRINEKGYFEFDLVNDRKYRLYVMSDSIFTIIRDVELNQDTMFHFFTRSFEKNKPIVFEAMGFRSNSAKLSASVKPKLDYIIRFLDTYPMFKLEVEGHTDSDGRAESNLRLSNQRAASIADYIIRKGEFDTERITFQGYGETRPIVPNDTEENKEKNRRVEFKLVFDETYDGEMFLPSEEELILGDKIENIDDPEYDSEFDWTDEELEQLEKDQRKWEEELELEDDLDAELESDILMRANDEKPDSKKSKKKKD